MEDRKRFSGLDWTKYTNRLHITIAGLGGIGSNLVIPLSRVVTNSKFYLHDNDSFEEVNLAGQLVRRSDIRNPKVDVARDNIMNYSSTNVVNTFQTRITKVSGMTSPITIVGTDSISSRREIFERWYGNYSNNNTAVFIDGRLAVKSYKMFLLIPGTKEIEEYREKELTDEVIPAPCTMSQTTHVANLLCSRIVGAFVNWCAREDGIRDIPYSIYENLFSFDNPVIQKYGNNF